MCSLLTGWNVGEVQARCRGGHATVDVAVNGLIISRVALFGATVQVGRDGNLADSLQHVGKGDAISFLPTAVPVKGDFPRVAALLAARGCQDDLTALDGDSLRQGALFPALAVAHQALPHAVARGLEYLLIVARQHRFQAEDLYR